MRKILGLLTVFHWEHLCLLNLKGCVMMTVFRKSQQVSSCDPSGQGPSLACCSRTSRCDSDSLLLNPSSSQTCSVHAIVSNRPFSTPCRPKEILTSYIYCYLVSKNLVVFFCWIWKINTSWLFHGFIVTHESWPYLTEGMKMELEQWKTFPIVLEYFS